MAGGNVKTFVIAGILTILLFLVINHLNTSMDEGREEAIVSKMDEVLEDFEDIESSYYLMEYLSATNASCDAVIKQLSYLEQRLWRLDNKIKEYYEIVQDFGGEEFYLREKRRLNRRALIQLSMLAKVQEYCNYNQTVILYFYGNCKTDPRCGQQGFVLSYINEKIEPEIVIFSFDADRDVESVKTLMHAYEVNKLPCMVIEGHTHCGLRNNQETEGLLCKYSPHLSICGKKEVNSTESA
jgi:hypothetical protein